MFFIPLADVFNRTSENEQHLWGLFITRKSAEWVAPCATHFTLSGEDDGVVAKYVLNNKSKDNSDFLIRIATARSFAKL